MLITANQPFGEWNTIFPDPAMTLAAVDRLAHHATIFEMNVKLQATCCRTSKRARTASAKSDASQLKNRLTRRDNQNS